MKDIGPRTKELIENFLGFLVVLFVFWLLFVQR
jgi:hypothetical protein